MNPTLGAVVGGPVMHANGIPDQQEMNMSKVFYLYLCNMAGLASQLLLWKRNIMMHACGAPDQGRKYLPKPKLVSDLCNVYLRVGGAEPERADWLQRQAT